MNKYYLFSFSYYAGSDKVFSFETSDNLRPGDLYKAGDGYLINLGTEIFFESKYDTHFKMATDLDVYCKGFLGAQTLEFIHFLVYQYYTSYNKVIGLFLDFDIYSLFKKKIDKNTKPRYQSLVFDYGRFEMEVLPEKKSGQILSIFPDLWTMKNSLPTGFEENILHGGSTQSRKNKIFWQIKTGHMGEMFCTYSQIFQDYRDLKEIILIDSHKWYYKNQQDPRYYVPTVVIKMAEIYGAKLIDHGIKIF